MEATQHLVTMALSLSTKRVIDLWFFSKCWFGVSVPVEEGRDVQDTCDRFSLKRNQYQQGHTVDMLKICLAHSPRYV